MKIIPEYGSSAFIVPSSVLVHLNNSSDASLACLLYVLSQREFSPTEAARELGIDEKMFLSAVRTWEERGVISTEAQSSAARRSIGANAVPKKKKTVKRSASLPAYTTEETARFLEENKKTAEIIDSCENIIGKIFTTAEINIIIGLLDHLSLSGDYILLLFAHAAKIEKKSVRYIEKLALSFADRDITSYKELESELAAIELTESTLKMIRRLFGIGARAFTAKERRMVTDWCVTWGFGNEIIEKAYEITANSTGDASLSYANAILENWHKANLATLEEIERFSEEFDRNKKSAKGYPKNNAPAAESSFDTDEFWEAALKRSFNEDPRNKT